MYVPAGVRGYTRNPCAFTRTRDVPAPVFTGEVPARVRVRVVLRVPVPDPCYALAMLIHDMMHSQVVDPRSQRVQSDRMVNLAC